jgi:hypothetical protein
MSGSILNLEMMGKDDEVQSRYLLFPIELLQNTDIQEVCRNAFKYSIYRKAIDYAVPNEKINIVHIQKAMEYFNLNVNDLDNRLKKGRELFDTFSFRNPMVSINKNIMIDFENTKSDFEVSTFRAYCAIRSILGKKPYCKATNDYLLARMQGFTSVAEFMGMNKSEPIGRYQLDKIKLELQTNWGLIYYSRQTRGFYISYRITLENLILKAEQKRQSNKVKKLKELKSEAFKKAMDKLFFPKK